MNPIFKKMNYKDQERMLVLSAPDSFIPALQEMENLCQVDTAIAPDFDYGFVLLFATKAAELKIAVGQIKDQFSENDPLLWLAYPKKSSKLYQSDINRDMDWSFVGELGFEGVRQVAIDADWSALRFRHARFIKKMKRDPKRAISKEGQEKLS